MYILRLILKIPVHFVCLLLTEPPNGIQQQRHTVHVIVEVLVLLVCLFHFREGTRSTGSVILKEKHVPVDHALREVPVILLVFACF